MNKIKTIIGKEWLEIFRNRIVIFTMIFLPLLMTALPLLILYTTRGTVSSAAGEFMPSELPANITAVMCSGGLQGVDCFQVYLVSQFMMLFMLIPVAIPATIAAYSIVGEKTTRSLEPLLATPITTIELLVGKCLSAVIPAVLATFAGFGIFALGSWLIVSNKLLLSALLDARWLIAIFVVGPLLAIMAVLFSLMVSSRVNDPRVAEQISMVIIVPILAGFFGQISGLFILDKQLIVIIAIVMLGLDALMVYLATQLFQRESILTRWK
jgi:ABC-2 type transport system permease protein